MVLKKEGERSILCRAYQRLSFPKLNFLRATNIEAETTTVIVNDNIFFTRRKQFINHFAARFIDPSRVYKAQRGKLMGNNRKFSGKEESQQINLVKKTEEE